jgi:hypothetical protein
LQGRMMLQQLSRYLACSALKMPDKNNIHAIYKQ